MDFTFNWVCDGYLIGTRSDGALLVSLITPLNDDYELYDNAKCILESTAEDGQVLIRLGNEDTLGRELRTYVQTDKYVRHKLDGTEPESTRKILRNIAADNHERRKRLMSLLGNMLAAADYYVAGQTLKVKATTPMAALDEAMAYLVQNTFTKMGYLKRVHPEPLREIQAILRSNDIGQQTLALQMEEGNKDVIDDLRSYVTLSTNASRQIVLHEMIEKRYTLRPYGWPDDEVLLLVKKLLALDTSYRFIEQFNSQTEALLDFADLFTDLEQFYQVQKPTWEKLRRAYDRFQLNRLELERDAQAGAALKRMQEILTAPSPYNLIKEAEGLIKTVDAANTGRVATRKS